MATDPARLHQLYHDNRFGSYVPPHEHTHEPAPKPAAADPAAAAKTNPAFLADDVQPRKGRRRSSVENLIKEGLNVQTSYSVSDLVADMHQAPFTLQDRDDEPEGDAPPQQLSAVAEAVRLARSRKSSAASSASGRVRLEDLLTVKGSESYKPVPMSVSSLVAKDYQEAFTLSDQQGEGTHSAPSSPQQVRQQAREQYRLGQRRHTHHLTHAYTSGAERGYLHERPTGVSGVLAEGYSPTADGPASAGRDVKTWRHAKQNEMLSSATRRQRALTLDELSRAQAKAVAEAAAKAREVELLQSIGAKGDQSVGKAWYYRSGRHVPQSNRPLHAYSDHH